MILWQFFVLPDAWKCRHNCKYPILMPYNTHACIKTKLILLNLLNWGNVTCIANRTNSLVITHCKFGNLRLVSIHIKYCYYYYYCTLVKIQFFRVLKTKICFYAFFHFPGKRMISLFLILLFNDRLLFNCYFYSRLRPTNCFQIPLYLNPTLLSVVTSQSQPLFSL
jgi:hypothetical protein